MADRPTRAGALIAGVCVAGGAAAVVVALLKSLEIEPTAYVSEAGDADAPYASTYGAGMYALAAGLLLLAVAVRPAVPRAAVLLGASAVAIALSGTVPCTDGCPLPPYEPTTAVDLVHAAVSVTAVAAWVLAIAAGAAWGGAAPKVRRLSLGAAVLALPLSAAVAVAILVVGRGPVASVLERIQLTVVVLWTVGTAAAIGFHGAGHGRAAQVGGAARVRDWS